MIRKGYKRTTAQKGKTRQLVKKQWEAGICKKSWHLSDETRKKPNGFDFNLELKTNVRNKDVNTCQRCLRDFSLSSHEKKLSVHHIDYDEKNNKELNLISLCVACHSRTNINRITWERYFKQLKKVKNKKYAHKEVLIISTRPDVIKMYPIWKKLGTDAIVINISQQKELTQEALKIFDWHPEIDLELMEESQTLPMIISKTLSLLPSILHSLRPTRVWVHGDTGSAYAAALTATLAKIPLVHVEAGLRSFDMNNPFPEEMFRTQIDYLSNILFAPTGGAVNNLVQEKALGEIVLVGNTVVDALEMMKSKLPDERPIEEKYVLATVHRRESFGVEMQQIFEALKELSNEIKVVLPAHPNPNVQKIIKKVGLTVVQPMNYLDFLWYLKHCEYVVSDSGGIQEEAPSFEKKTIILRKKTERPEAVQMGMSILVDPLTKENILHTIRTFTSENIVFDGNPFGDGHAAEKIIQYMQERNEKES